MILSKVEYVYLVTLSLSVVNNRLLVRILKSDQGQLK